MEDLERFHNRLREILRDPGAGQGLMGELLEDTQHRPATYVEMAAVEIIDGEKPDGRYHVGFDPVLDIRNSAFSHFEDGIQRTIHIGNPISPLGRVPLFACVRAAAILARTNGEITVTKAATEMKLALLKTHADALGLENDEMVETIADHNLGIDPVEPFDYSRIAQAVAIHASSQRHQMEHGLIDSFLQSADKDARIYIDGTLINVTPDPRTIGVAKTSQTIIHPLDYRVIYTLNEGERSCAFKLPAQIPGRVDPQSHERLSWFLRLRTPHHPTYGLVRVEASVDLDRSEVDRISRWILAEREPPPLKDGRWDRMVYGIYLCERYLESIVPTPRALSALQHTFR